MSNALLCVLQFYHEETIAKEQNHFHYMLKGVFVAIIVPKLEKEVHNRCGDDYTCQ